MSITDELRKYANTRISPNKGMLTAIADRIDAEHESACAEAYGNGVESVALPDMTAYVKLPVDAEGKPIRIGDVLTDGEYTFRVDELAVYGDGSWSIRNEDGNAWAACDVTHHHEPTVEDVLRDFAQEMSENMGLYTGEAIDADEWRDADARTVAKYAARLELREVGA